MCLSCFSPTRDELQRWSQSFDQLMRSTRTYHIAVAAICFSYYCMSACIRIASPVVA